jgi:hypothetical protein
MSETGLQNDVDMQFIYWLKSHGATFPKIEWPALNDAGVKGGIAKENIEVCGTATLTRCCSDCPDIVQSLCFPL